MSAFCRIDNDVRRIGGGRPLQLVIDGKTSHIDDRANVAAFIEDACIHVDPATCDDPLIRALHAFVQKRS